MNTGRSYQAGFGIQTAGLIVGGNANGSASTATESYDGTSFATTTSLGTASNDGGGAGSSTLGVFAGGGPTRSSRTEEFTEALITRTMDVS